MLSQVKGSGSGTRPVRYPSAPRRLPAAQELCAADPLAVEIQPPTASAVSRLLHPRWGITLTNHLRNGYMAAILRHHRKLTKFLQTSNRPIRIKLSPGASASAKRSRTSSSRGTKPMVQSRSSASPTPKSSAKSYRKTTGSLSDSSSWNVLLSQTALSTALKID